LSGRRLIRRRPFSRSVFAVFLGFSGGDADAAFANEVDVVADRFRASIIFRLPALKFMYHSIALDFNPFCLCGNEWIRIELRGDNTNFSSYLHFHAMSQYPGGEAGVIAFL
jgi:hypothetical protein